MNVVRAAVLGDVETVRQWLSSPQHKRPEHAGQVLIEAARCGHCNICQLMLNSCCVSDGCRAQALTETCLNNQLSTTQLLVKHGHISTQNLPEALSSACLYGHMRIVMWLITDVMTLSHTDRIRWLLTSACARGDMRDIQQLATQVDTDVTRVTSQALRVACFNGRNDAVKWLTLHSTADVSSLGVIHKLYDEMTSLMIACDRSNCGIARRLLQCVTPHTVNMMSDNRRNTALHFIVWSEIAANCHFVNACSFGDIDTAANMLHVSNVNLQAAGGHAALHFACCQGHVDTVRILLAAFASTDVTDDERRTPAMWANIMCHTEVLSYLQYTDCTQSATPDSHVYMPESNNTVPISVLSVKHATNSPNTTAHNKAKLSKIRLV